MFSGCSTIDCLRIPIHAAWTSLPQGEGRPVQSENTFWYNCTVYLPVQKKLLGVGPPLDLDADRASSFCMEQRLFYPLNDMPGHAESGCHSRLDAGGMLKYTSMSILRHSSLGHDRGVFPHKTKREMYAFQQS